jgi:hypothetical protein
VLGTKYTLLGTKSNYSEFSSYKHWFHVSGGYIKEAQSTENSTLADMHNFTSKMYWLVLVLVTNLLGSFGFSFHMAGLCLAGSGTK